MAKKANKAALKVVTPELLTKALKKVIGFADHPQENEDKIFSFVITREIHDLLKTKAPISFEGLFDNIPCLIDKMHAAQIEKYVKPYEKTCPIHEIISIDDNNDDGVWIVIEVRILGLIAALEPHPVYYRVAKEYN